MRRMLLLHRWIVGAVDKTGYRFLVDHIDRDPWNCQRDNLRIVTPAESNLNRVVAKRDLPVGVHLSKGKYQARLKRGGTVQHLGTFTTVEEAVAARAAALV